MPPWAEVSFRVILEHRSKSIRRKVTQGLSETSLSVRLSYARRLSGSPSREITGLGFIGKRDQAAVRGIDSEPLGIRLSRIKPGSREPWKTVRKTRTRSSAPSFSESDVVRAGGFKRSRVDDRRWMPSKVSRTELGRWQEIGRTPPFRKVILTRFCNKQLPAKAKASLRRPSLSILLWCARRLLDLIELISHRDSSRSRDRVVGMFVAILYILYI